MYFFSTKISLNVTAVFIILPELLDNFSCQQLELQLCKPLANAGSGAAAEGEADERVNLLVRCKSTKYPWRQILKKQTFL